MFHTKARVSMVSLLAVALSITNGARIGRSQTPELPGLAATTAPCVNETPSVLTLGALEQMALAYNPTLVQAGAQIQISRGQAFQAGLRLNPQIGYVADQIGAAGTAGELHGIFVEQEIVTGHKLQLSRAKYMQEAREAELLAMVQQYRVLYSVRVAYYELLIRQKRRDIRAELHTNATEAATTVKELVNVGQANLPDNLQAQVESQKAKAELQRAEREYQAAWDQLAAFVGLPELPQKSVDGKLDFDNAERIDRDAAITNLLACSPMLRAAEAEAARDRIAVERERVEPIPNLTVRAETGYNFETDNTVAGLQLGLRLPVFDKNQGTVAAAQGELMRAEAEVRRLELKLRQRFAQSFAEYDSAVVMAKTYHDEILPKAKDAYRLYFDSFQKQRAAWPQVLDSQRQYFQLYESYLDNLLEARRAEAEIATFFVGEGLDQPSAPTPEGHRDTTPKPR